jgi:dihydroorotate dehydrogenase electron transfer subunit
MLYQEDCQVIENTKVVADHFKISFACKDISKNAKPGQFVQIKVSSTTTPLLRRPFSFHKVGKDNFEVLYHVVGKGTEILSKTKTGEKINIIGPLGNGFDIKTDKIAVLIGGGCGSAPLYCLEEELKRQNIESHFFMGASTDGLLLCQSELAKLKTKLYISTDDGSCGEKCNVAALYSSYLSSFDKKKTVIYACGPKAMLKAVADIALKENIPCQVSLEEHMACGIGACLGCVVETVNGNKRVCKDGPVFDAKELIWH